MNLDTLLRPRSIAVVGLSADPSKLSGRPAGILRAAGFAGRLYAVNPARDEVQGVPSFPTATDLPEAVDVGLVCVPAPLVAGAVADLARLGTRNAIVLTAGFNETRGGQDFATQLSAVVASEGMNLLGPNSLGLWSLPGRALMTHSAAAMNRDLVEGPVTILSQSGSLGAAMARWMLDRGIGLRYLVSLGNELGLTMMDLLAEVVAEGGCRVVILFIEGLRDGHRLSTLLRAARAAGVVPITIKAGVSPAGISAIATHTGKLATPGRLYDDIVRGAGGLTVATITEAMSATEALAANGAMTQLDADTRGIGVVSASGGSRALIVDEAWRRGLPVATFTPTTTAAVDAVLADTGNAGNPVDVDGSALYDPVRLRSILTAVANDPNVDALVLQLANRGAQQVAELEHDLVEVRHQTGKPLVIGLLLDGCDPALETRLRSAGVLFAIEPSATVALVSHLYAARGGQPVAGSPGTQTSADEDTRAPSSADAAGANGLTEPVTGRSWAEHMTVAKHLEIPLAPLRVVRNRHDLDEAWAAMRSPLVVKALPESANHKADRGLVRLDAATLEEAAAAVEAIRAEIGASAPVLVQEMVTSGVEVLLAARQDSDLGPVLAIGSGGNQVELEADVTYLPCGADEGEIRAAIGRLRLDRVLAGYRGTAAADRDALVLLAMKVGQRFPAITGAVVEVEINPLFVRPGNGGVTAVDLRVVWTSNDQASADR